MLYPLMSSVSILRQRVFYSCQGAIVLYPLMSSVGAASGYQQNSQGGTGRWPLDRNKRHTASDRTHEGHL